MRKFSKRATVGAVFAGVMLLAGVAFATWTATGSGSASSKAASLQGLTTVTTATSATASLYPGQTTGSLHIDVHNPNPFDVDLTEVSWTNGANPTANDSGDANCLNSSVSLNNSSPYTVPSGGQTIAANSDGSIDVPSAVSMASTADTSCQG